MTGEIDGLNLGSFICLEFILSDVEGFPIFFANAFPTAKKDFHSGRAAGFYLLSGFGPIRRLFYTFVKCFRIPNFKEWTNCRREKKLSSF
jgi:hypothetical protein